MSQAAALQELHDDESVSWGETNLIIVNLPGYESGLPELSEGVSLPILQDTTEADVANTYGASKWYVYVIDQVGNLRYLHYEVDLSRERERLLEEIATLHAEAR